jgi:hypothetical protein
MGARLLDQHGVPGRRIVSLDPMPAAFSPVKWASAKIHTYRLQTGPFLHLDHDVFLERDLPAAPPGVQLTVQSLENLPDHCGYYAAAAAGYFQAVGPRLGDISRLLVEGRPHAYNCAVFCAHTKDVLPFVARYGAAAWDIFIRWQTLNQSINAFAEQMNLYAMAGADGLPVRCLLPTDPVAMRAEAGRLGYRHLGGEKRRRREESLRWILDRLSVLT